MAVKLLARTAWTTPRQWPRFSRKWKPSAVSIVRMSWATDAACIDGVYFLAMDYVSARTLLVCSTAPGDSRSPTLAKSSARQTSACNTPQERAGALRHQTVQPHAYRARRRQDSRFGTGQVSDGDWRTFRQPWPEGSTTWLRNSGRRTPTSILADIYGLGTPCSSCSRAMPFEQAPMTRRQAHESAPIPAVSTVRSDFPRNWTLLSHGCWPNVRGNGLPSRGTSLKLFRHFAAIANCRGLQSEPRAQQRIQYACAASPKRLSAGRGFASSAQDDLRLLCSRRRLDLR